MIELAEYAGVANLDCKREVFRQLTEERIELPNEVSRQHAVALEFEQERTGVWAEARFSIRRKDHIVEQGGIEKTFVRLHGLHTIARMVRKCWDGEFFRDFA